MANEMKACCGGFLVGEGLTMDGKVLKATGGGGSDSKIKMFALRQLMSAQGYNHAVLLGAKMEDVVDKVFVVYKYEDGFGINRFYTAMTAEEQGIEYTAFLGVGKPTFDNDIFNVVWYVKQENAQGLLLTDDPTELM